MVHLPQGAGKLLRTPAHGLGADRNRNVRNHHNAMKHKRLAPCGASRLAPQVGLEPTTLRLTAECSAIELLRIIGMRRRSTLPGRYQPSTIDVLRLNFCVRNGNRWNPQAIATAKGELSWGAGERRTACCLRSGDSRSLPWSLSLPRLVSSPRCASLAAAPRCPLGRRVPTHPDNRTGRTDHFRDWSWISILIKLSTD